MDEAAERGPDIAPAPDARPAAFRRVAVVLVHAQADAEPEAALTELARTVWRSDPDLAQTRRPEWGEEVEGRLRLWSAPGVAPGSRRLTTEAPWPDETPAGGAGKRLRIDFHALNIANHGARRPWRNALSGLWALLTRPAEDTPYAYLPLRRIAERYAQLTALAAAAFAGGTAALILALPGTASLLTTAREGLAAAGMLAAAREAAAGLTETIDWLSPETPGSLGAGLAAPVQGWSAIRAAGEAAARLGVFALVALAIPLAALWIVWGPERPPPEPAVRPPPRRGMLQRAPRGAAASKTIRTAPLKPAARQDGVAALRARAAQRLGVLQLSTWLAAAGAAAFVLVALAAGPGLDWGDLALLCALAAAVAPVVAPREAPRRGAEPGWPWALALIAFGVALIPIAHGPILAGLIMAGGAAVLLALRGRAAAALVTAGLVFAAGAVAGAGLAGARAGASFAQDAPVLAWAGWTIVYAVVGGYLVLIDVATGGRRWRMAAFLAAVIAAAGLAWLTVGPGARDLAEALRLWAGAEAGGGALDPRSPAFVQFMLGALALIAVGAGAALAGFAVRSTAAGALGAAHRHRREPKSGAHAAAVSLFEALHAQGGYDRIIVVGHAMGSVVAYEALHELWARRCARLHLDGDVEGALELAERAARQLAIAQARRVSLAAKDIHLALRLTLGPALIPPPAGADRLGGIAGERRARSYEAARRVHALRVDGAIAALESIGASQSRLAAQTARALAAGPARYQLASDALADLARALAPTRERGARTLALMRRASERLAAAARAQQQFHDAQAAYLAALVSRAAAEPALRNDPPWLVSDFVTLGSPLALGPALLWGQGGGPAARAESHRAALCPPFLEKEPPARLALAASTHRFSYPRWMGEAGASEIAPHFGPHAGALFAATRWTNIYFVTEALVAGDIAAGPLWRHFGLGVVDMPVTVEDAGVLFAHGAYWSSALSDPALRALKPALSAAALFALNEAQLTRALVGLPEEDVPGAIRRSRPGHRADALRTLTGPELSRLVAALREKGLPGHIRALRRALAL